MLVRRWSEGCRGKELRELVGVDQAALDYEVKRVRRDVEALSTWMEKKAMTATEQKALRTKTELDRSRMP